MPKTFTVLSFKMLLGKHAVPELLFSVEPDEETFQQVMELLGKGLANCEFSNSVVAAALIFELTHAFPSFYVPRFLQSEFVNSFPARLAQSLRRASSPVECLALSAWFCNCLCFDLGDDANLQQRRNAIFMANARDAYITYAAFLDRNPIRSFLLSGYALSCYFLRLIQHNEWEATPVYIVAEQANAYARELERLFPAPATRDIMTLQRTCNLALWSLRNWPRHPRFLDSVQLLEHRNYELVQSDKNQYSVGAPASCTLASLEAGLYLMCGRAPSRELIDHSLQVASLYKGSLHLDVDMILAQVPRYTCSMIIMEDSTSTLDALLPQLAEKRASSRVSALLTGMGVTVFVTMTKETWWLYDSHPRPHHRGAAIISSSDFSLLDSSLLTLFPPLPMEIQEGFSAQEAAALLVRAIYLAPSGQIRLSSLPAIDINSDPFRT